MQAAEILRVDQITKKYGDGEGGVTAVNQVSFSVQRGEFVVVIGPSGCGKSTLLHMIGGVEQPTSGKIFVGKMNIAQLSTDRCAVFRRKNIGIVYQGYNLIPVLTAKENILLPLQLDRRNADMGYFNALIRRLELEDKLESLPRQLSGGQQQRVAIARALMSKPALLLADEPTGNLDTARSKEVISHIKRLNAEEGQTILLVTHDPRIAALGSRVIQMKDGSIVRDEVRAQ